MNLVTLLSPQAVACIESVSSKKRALEVLAGLLTDINPQLGQDQIFDSLMEREHLGTTALGKGVAIPHCRLSEMTKASIVFIKIDSGIDYDAPDGLPVDILVALVVPEESTEEHLQLLAALAELLSDNQFVTRYRDQQDSQSLFQYLSEYLKITGTERLDVASEATRQQLAS